MQDAASLTGSDEFDFITTFDAVHDQAKPRDMVRGIFNSLKPNGYWLCADLCASSHLGENLDHPIGTFGYTVSCMHCMSVSLAYDGEGLGASGVLNRHVRFSLMQGSKLKKSQELTVMQEIITTFVENPL